MILAAIDTLSIIGLLSLVGLGTASATGWVAHRAAEASRRKNQKSDDAIVALRHANRRSAAVLLDVAKALGLSDDQVALFGRYLHNLKENEARELRTALIDTIRETETAHEQDQFGLRREIDHLSCSTKNYDQLLRDVLKSVGLHASSFDDLDHVIDQLGDDENAERVKAAVLAQIDAGRESFTRLQQVVVDAEENVVRLNE